MALWPGWGSHLPSMCRAGGQQICAGVVGGQWDYCLPDRQTFFYIYIYINTMVLLWSIKDPLEIHSGGLP